MFRAIHKSVAWTLASAMLAACAVAQQADYKPHVGQQGKDVVWVPTPDEVVERMLVMAQTKPEDFVVDLGAGDGGLLYALELEGLLGDTAYAVDLSEERLAFCAALSPKIETVRADATAVPLPDGVAGGLVCTQVIEHLPDDRLLAPENSTAQRPAMLAGTIHR